MSAEAESTTHGTPPETRRDFLYLATGAVGAVGVIVAAWPLIDALNPTADVVALSTTEIDLSPMEVGQRITVVWTGRPIFVCRRTQAEIDQAKRDDNSPTLIDPATDAERVQRESWLIVIGICTHLGCVPLGQKSNDPRSEYGGWFCPCHGSKYDTAGRVRRGPAPRNLDLPPYAYLNDTLVKVG